jgi:1-acyl-sn-glycerol-3-phosphate acyltransferase
LNILRTIVFMGYLFGYMLVHLPVLRKGEKALAAGDTETVDAITKKHVTRWCSTLLKLSGSSVTVEGQENVPAGRACVFVANHRSCFDIPVMLTVLDKPWGLLSKIEADRIPLVRRWMRLIGCVFVDRSDIHASMRALADATHTVEAGRSFSIFPEGTRYKGEEGGIGEFKGGAFRIATKCGAPVVPVVLTGTRAAFETHHHIVTPSRITVRILPPIETAPLSRTEQKELPAKVQQLIADALAQTKQA